MSVLRVNWSALKATKDNNPTSDVYYSMENEHTSNDPNIPDTVRYFLEITVQGAIYQCFVAKVANPATGSDQEDFEDNYKPNAIETS